MSKPTLTYFDFPGSRGEECRLALTIAGVDFTDNRIATKDWPELKPNTAWGSPPMLELEGRTPLGQSNAILSYIGREHGLLPSDSWEAAHHEALLAAAEELRGTVMPALRIKDEQASIAAREELASGYLHRWGALVEAKLGDGPFVGGPFVGGKDISVADIKLYMVSKWFSSGGVDHVPSDVFAHCPKLMAIQRAVKEHPKVVEWYARG
jgi:glutathione S-transferase